MKPNSILGRYVNKQLVFNFLAVLFIILGIIFLFEMVERLRRISGSADFGVWFAVQLAVSRLPKTVEQVFPFVMMIAAMVTFWRLGKTNEFVVMRAAGVSVWNFLTPVCAATLIIGVINVTMINPIAAGLYGMYETLERRVDTQNPKAMMYSEQGLWIREATDEGNTMVLNAKKLQHEKDELLLRGVTIIELDEKTQPLRRIEAFAGVLRDGFFSLKDVRIYQAGKPVELVNDMEYKTVLDMGRIEDSFAEPEAISFWALPDVIRFYDKSGFAVQRHQMRFWSLVISPLFLVTMVLMAAVFALRPSHRAGGVIFLIVGGIIAGFSTYFMSQLVYAMGISGGLPVGLAVIAPTMIAGSVAASALLQLEGE
ncbi:MAG: LPS export ABC transporter permease LptG [Alphaproteobacteria bacterium]|nr:LPS export ABC transporter permease LptG [Alphaproteobacteria bacterium]